jgi:predicted Ser/Thr protein kinase
MALTYVEFALLTNTDHGGGVRTQVFVGKWRGMATVAIKQLREVDTSSLQEEAKIMRCAGPVFNFDRKRKTGLTFVAFSWPRA